MAITKAKKEEVLSKVKSIAESAKTLVFANFKGLTVAGQNELRRGLRAQDVGYTVAKKTLLRLALVGKYTGEMPPIEGEIALVYGADELAPAREFAVFVKKYQGQLAFAGGVFGGAFASAEKMQSVAAIPSLNTLRAQFVQLIHSPLQRFAVVLNEKAKAGE